MKLLIPGKTFLVGEYAVLVGGKALGVATTPYFETKVDQQPRTSVHPESAAGLFLKNIDQWPLEIDSVTSSYGQGGFGQSTAEYITAWFKYHRSLEVKEMFRQYRALFMSSSSAQKMRPSGADLMIQLLGKMTYFDQDITQCKSLDWAFPEIGFDIISTGAKVATHDHIATLNLKNLEPLIDLADQVVAAYLKKDQAHFISSMQTWSLKLQALGLQHNHSLELKHLIEKCPAVLLAKPNGALGADTITVFYRVQDAIQVKRYLHENKMINLTGLESLAPGAHDVD